MRKPSYKKIDQPDTDSFIVIIYRRGYAYACTFAADSTEEMILSAIREGHSDSDRSRKPFKPFNESTGLYL